MKTFTYGHAFSKISSSGTPSIFSGIPNNILVSAVRFDRVSSLTVDGSNNISDVTDLVTGESWSSPMVSNNPLWNGSDAASFNGTSHYLSYGGPLSIFTSLNEGAVFWVGSRPDTGARELAFTLGDASTDLDTWRFWNQPVGAGNSPNNVAGGLRKTSLDRNPASTTAGVISKGLRVVQSTGSTYEIFIGSTEETVVMDSGNPNDGVWFNDVDTGNIDNAHMGRSSQSVLFYGEFTIYCMGVTNRPLTQAEVNNLVAEFS